MLDRAQTATEIVPFTRALHMGQSAAGDLKNWLHASQVHMCPQGCSMMQAPAAQHTTHSSVSYTWSKLLLFAVAALVSAKALFCAAACITMLSGSRPGSEMTS